MWNLKVKVIKAGTCTIDPGNSASPIQVGLKHQLGIGGGSSVVVIREGDEILLVDTGFEREGDVSSKGTVPYALLQYPGTVHVFHQPVRPLRGYCANGCLLESMG
jgi:hypothetical protein